MSGTARIWTTEAKAIAAVAILVLLVAVLRPSHPGDEEEAPRPSTLLAGPGGGLALYLAAQEIGIRVERRMLPYDADSGPAISSIEALAVLAPDEPILPSEIARLGRWPRLGGRLLYVPSPLAPDNRFLEEMGLRVPVTREALGTLVLAAPVRLRRLQDGLSPEARTLLEGCPPSLALAGSFERLPGGAASVEPLYAAGEKGERIGAALVRVGRGSALVLCDPEPIVNRSLRLAGAASLALRALARTAEGSTLWFDEYHHGFDERGSLERETWRFLTGTPSGLAVLEASVIGLVALAAAGIRFGSAIPPPRPRRRSSLEHVDALAAAYAGARAGARPAALLVEGLRLGLREPGPERLRERLAAVAGARPDLRDAAEDVLAASGGARPPTEADLVRLARSADRILAAAAPGEGAAEGGEAGRPRPRGMEERERGEH